MTKVRGLYTKVNRRRGIGRKDIYGKNKWVFIRKEKWVFRVTEHKVNDNVCLC